MTLEEWKEKTSDTETKKLIYKPKLNCKFCRGSGMKYDVKLDLYYPCMCNFVEHEFCEQVEESFIKLREELEKSQNQKLNKKFIVLENDQKIYAPDKNETNNCWVVDENYEYLQDKGRIDDRINTYLIYLESNKSIITHISKHKVVKLNDKFTYQGIINFNNKKSELELELGMTPFGINFRV